MCGYSVTVFAVGLYHVLLLVFTVYDLPSVMWMFFHFCKCR